MSRVKEKPSASIITQKALGFIFAFAHQIPMVSILKILMIHDWPKRSYSPLPSQYIICATIQNTLSPFVKRLLICLLGNARTTMKTCRSWTVSLKNRHAQIHLTLVSSAFMWKRPLSSHLTRSPPSYNAKAGFVTIHVCWWDSCTRKELDCGAPASHDARPSYLPWSRDLRWISLRYYLQWGCQVEVSVHAS